MPLPKSLQRTPVRRTSSSTSAGSSRRKRCPVCNHLDPRDHPSSIYPDEVNQSRRVNLSLIIDAYDLVRNRAITDRGCRFCNVLVQALDAFMENWRGVRTKINVDIEEKRTIKVSIDDERWQGTLVEIYAASSSRAPWPTLGTAYHIPNNAGSDDTFDFIRRCISGCLANPKHSACRSTDSSSISTPKRLVDVGRAASPIHLIDTQGKAFQYAALSHCWGNSPQLTTTKSNWAKLAVNISFEKLPALFQDAVIITRQLGLRYIWIDSLCIIQDSMRDWETESSKMGSIYQNAYITISATNAGDGSVRCLNDRRKPVKIHYQNTVKKEFWLRARKTLEQHPRPGADGSPAKPIGPLTSRAWALQEHVLSTRILHYTATELLFECRTSYRCECSPERKSWPTTPALIPKAIASKNPSAIFQAWQQIVGQYSSRSLTMPGDKLTAISGVASKIRKCTHSAYLAGLWKDNLASDLLWSSEPTDASALTHAIQPNWRAPTFSWASLDISVKYTVLDDDERKVFKPTITLLADNIKTKGLNPLGAVADASITLRGPTSLATLTSANVHGSWTYTLCLKGTSTIDIVPDSHLVQAEVQTKDGSERVTVQRMRPGAVLKSFTAPVLCISIARYDNVLAGLVLGFVHELPMIWQRVGTFAAGTEAMQNAEEMEVILA